MAKSTSITVPAPRQLSSGNWFIQLRLGGESVPVTAPTDKECIQQATLLKAEHKAGKRVAAQNKANPTLRQAIDNYIAARSNTLSPSTIDGYRRIQKNRFQSVADKKLQDIKDWQSVCNNEAKLCSAKTLKNAYGFIVSVLGENGIHPKKITLPQVVQNPREWLEPEEIKVLVESVKDTPGEVGTLLALHGLRRSELLALDWKSVDFKNKTITIRGAMVTNEKHKFIDKKTNKNQTSARTIPIMIPELQTALEAVTLKEGKVITCSPHTVCNRINAACRSANLPEVGTHGCRYSFASLAYHLKLSELETMELGGWADTQTMHKIYIHLAQKDRLKAENKMTEFYKNANKNANENKITSIISAYTAD